MASIKVPGGTPSVTIPAYTWADDPIWHNWTYTMGTVTTAATVAANQMTVWRDNWITATGSLQFEYAEGVVWREWQNMDGSYTREYVMADPVRARVTEEERAARQRRHDAQQRRREQESARRLEEGRRRASRREAAERRAEELLAMVMTPEEVQYRARHDEVMVRGSDGAMYILGMYGQVHGNITRIDEHGCRLGRACVAPKMYEGNDALPIADGYVGQYLGLKHNAEEFLSHANWSGRRVCQQPDVPILERAVA